jgi:NAD(P)-dependent dehydrogenase (short-subunit alcohol dehydrogenase family)
VTASMPAAGGELTGRPAIVTGAAGGIGRATARLLAMAGADVVLADLPGTALDEAAAELADVEGVRVRRHEVDISDEASVAALVDYTVAELGGLGVLVNNAALLNLPEDTDVLSASVDAWQRLFGVNVIGTMTMCKHALGPMLAAGEGSIVNLSSTMATQGDAFATGYACTKGAIQTLTRFVATQYSERGVRCNAVAPGLVKTPALERGMSAELQGIFAESHLVGHLAEPEEVAEVVVFLASERSSFITGQVLAVDGGFSAHAPTTVDVRRSFQN